VEGVMITRGEWSKSWLDPEMFLDECSPTRHFFARLKLCSHKGEWLNASQYFHRIYGDIPLMSEKHRIFKDDQA